ncbi:RNA-binding ATPase activator esf2 [Serendipita sp. 400]|nr:RNA-binding ATPase activator esf2 [Serendipita sp. 400]
MPEVKSKASTSKSHTVSKPKPNVSNAGSDDEERRSDDSSDSSEDEEDKVESGDESKGAGSDEFPLIEDEDDGSIRENEDEDNALSMEALEAYKAKQNRAGVVYISRIPPAMSPSKVRHILSAYGEIGRVYLQQEDPKRAYLRQKYTSSKKPHYTEGWVEFLDKKVARSVAEMLNAQPVGGKKGSRFREDVWTMKYLPRFKWYMLTEQIAHEHATHAAKLRMELSQSKTEQKHYLKQVELGRSLQKRQEKKRKLEESAGDVPAPPIATGNNRISEHTKKATNADSNKLITGNKVSVEMDRNTKRRKKDGPGGGEGNKIRSISSSQRPNGDLDAVLGSIF